MCGSQGSAGCAEPEANLVDEYSSLPVALLLTAPEAWYIITAGALKHRLEVYHQIMLALLSEIRLPLLLMLARRSMRCLHIYKRGTELMQHSPDVSLM